MTCQTFIITYRDPETGAERSAYVDAASWGEAEDQIELIGSGVVTGELIETGVLDGFHLQIGHA